MITIRRCAPGDEDLVARAAHLFDGPVDPTARDRFLASDGHHLLVAQRGDAIVGFVSGVETVHPDKGTEMLLYEVAVAPDHQRQGLGTRLVEALADLARERGCYGMWVLTDHDNEAALATYRRAGADRESEQVMLDWRWRTAPDG